MDCQFASKLNKASGLKMSNQFGVMLLLAFPTIEDGLNPDNDRLRRFVYDQCGSLFSLDKIEKAIDSYLALPVPPVKVKITGKKMEEIKQHRDDYTVPNCVMQSVLEERLCVKEQQSRSVGVGGSTTKITMSGQRSMVEYHFDHTEALVDWLSHFDRWMAFSKEIRPESVTLVLDVPEHSSWFKIGGKIGIAE